MYMPILRFKWRRTHSCLRSFVATVFLFTGMFRTCLMVIRDPCRARLIVVVDTRGLCGHAVRTTSFIRFSVMVGSSSMSMR